MEEAQEKLNDLHKDKEITEKEIDKRDEEVNAFNKQLKNLQESFERVQLKLLSYRKEDIMDLLHSLQGMATIQNSKKKADILQNELLKIDSELFELEKKYGEFKIRKGSTIIPQTQQQTKTQPHADSSSSSNDQSSLIVANMPAVESSSMHQIPSYSPEKSHTQDDTLKEEQSFQEQDHQEQKRSKQQIRQDIDACEQKINQLEANIEEAVAKEEYEQAEEYQNEIDNVLREQIYKLREELRDAQDDIDHILNRDDDNNSNNGGAEQQQHEIQTQ